MRSYSDQDPELDITAIHQVHRAYSDARKLEQRCIARREIPFQNVYIQQRTLCNAQADLSRQLGITLTVRTFGPEFVM